MSTTVSTGHFEQGPPPVLSPQCVIENISKVPLQ